jgi:tetratricopeptide (TPR) repeat protein
VFSLTEMAKKAIEAKKYEKAVDLLNLAQHYPENLGEGKLYGAQENTLFYWLGCAYDGLGLIDKANESWQLASQGLNEPAPAIFYNDQQPDTIYYQGLALIKLGKTAEANERFKKLISFGELHLNDEFKLDYFAVSLPDLQIWDNDLSKRNRQNCLNLIALGESGLAQREGFTSGMRSEL